MEDGKPEDGMLACCDCSEEVDSAMAEENWSVTLLDWTVLKGQRRSTATSKGLGVMSLTATALP